jgi:hypothetical protein
LSVPITFQAFLKKRTSDADGQSIVTFVIPASDYDASSQVGKLVSQALYVTVTTAQEVAAQPQGSSCPSPDAVSG